MRKWHWSLETTSSWVWRAKPSYSFVKPHTIIVICRHPVKTSLRTITVTTAPIHGRGEFHYLVHQEIWVADITDECILGLDYAVTAKLTYEMGFFTLVINRFLYTRRPPRTMLNATNPRSSDQGYWFIPTHPLVAEWWLTVLGWNSTSYWNPEILLGPMEQPPTTKRTRLLFWGIT